MFISLTKYVADPYDKLPTITFWIMGSLASITKKDIIMLMVPFLVGSIPLFLVRWHLNTLSFGDEEAKALGIDTRKLRFLVIICSTILTASAVAVAGIVGWVGILCSYGYHT